MDTASLQQILEMAQAQQELSELKHNQQLELIVAAINNIASSC